MTNYGEILFLAFIDHYLSLTNLLRDADSLWICFCTWRDVCIYPGHIHTHAHTHTQTHTHTHTHTFQHLKIYCPLNCDLVFETLFSFASF